MIDFVVFRPGNGHIEIYEEDVLDTDGITVLHAKGDPKPVKWVNPNTGLTETRIEECDFGNLNRPMPLGADEEYKYPCNEYC